jgi:hypothetical protein
MYPSHPFLGCSDGYYDWRQVALLFYTCWKSVIGTKWTKLNKQENETNG